MARVDTQADQDLAAAADSTPLKEKRFLPFRVILLATLLFGLNAWTVRHLGSGLREFATVNSFLAFVGIALGWIEVRNADNLRAGFGRILKRTVDGPVLAALYLVTIVGTSFISSVTVIADGDSGGSVLFLTAEGNKRCEDCSGEPLDGPSGVVRYVRLTSIFGRPYYLEASGYQRKGFALYPWTGATISLSTDLVRLPTIVLRVPYSLHSSLAGGKIVLDFESPSGSFEIPMQAGRASAQLGPPAAIPEGWRREWRSELRTLDNVPDALREQFFRNWLNPIRNEQIPVLVPAQRIQVSYVTAAGKEVVRQQLVVGWEPLQEVILIPRE
jgi:hypothetical protein